MGKDESRRAIYKLRLLIWTECATYCIDKFGDDLQGPKLENEIMKVVRVRWKQQSQDVQRRLLQGDDVSVDMLNPFDELAADEVHEPDVAVDAGGGVAPEAPEDLKHHRVRHQRILNTIESCHCRCQDSLVYMRALLQGSTSDKLRATLEEEIADRERDLAVSFDLD